MNRIVEANSRFTIRQLHEVIEGAVSEATIWRWIVRGTAGKGKLKAQRIGRAYRIALEDFENYVLDTKGEEQMSRESARNAADPFNVLQISGPYEGLAYSLIPERYLRWHASDLDLDERSRAAIRQELQRRKDLERASAEDPGLCYGGWTWDRTNCSTVGC